MHKSLTIKYNHYNYSSSLRNFMEILLAPMHKSPLKTLQLITTTFLDVRKPILCELARQMPIIKDFKYILKRLWRFFSKSKFTITNAYAGIIPYFLDWLKDRKYLEILIDWTKVGCYSVLYLSLPYKKRAIPLFWRAVDYTDDESWQNKIERECIKTFVSLVPQYLRSKLVIVADRGFGKVEFFKFLKKLEVNFAIRVKGDVWVKHGRFTNCLRRVNFGKRKIRWWRNVLYHKTEQECLNLLLKYEVKDSLYITTNLSDAHDVLTIYSHRMRIEESFRDLKNKHCFSLREAKLGNTIKLEKLILVVVIAYMFVILFGAACECVKYLVNLVSMPKKKKMCKLLSSFRLGLALLKKLSPLCEYRWLFNFKKVCPKEA